MKRFVPASRVHRYPLGKDAVLATQIEFYERLTDKKCDLRDVAAATEPVIVAAQIKPCELCSVVTNCAI